MPLDPNIKFNEEKGSGVPDNSQVQPDKPIRPEAKYLYPTERFQKSLAPNQKYFYNYQIKRGEPEKQGYRMVPTDWSNAMIKQFAFPNQTYFAQDPRRLAKYHYFLESAPEGWDPPEWLNADKYNEAYNYMSKIYGSDWTQWEALDPDDPTSTYLTTIGDPPPEFRLPGEVNQEDQLLDYINGLTVNDYGLLSIADMDKSELQKLQDSMYGETKELSPFMQQGTWAELERWQQWALSFLSPQPMEGRPEISRLTAAGFQGLQAGMGGAAAAGILVGATGGTAIAGIPGTVIGAAAGLGVGLAAGYQAYTGVEIPGINKMLEVLDIFATTTEKVIGIGIQAADGETKEVLENLPAAYKAGEFTYEAGPTGVGVLNFMSGGFQAAENVFNKFGADVEWSTGTKADYKAGEIWALEKAIVEPMLVRGGLLGGAALDQARARIATAKDENDLEEIYLDYYDRFGYSGTIGDFVAQSILDPINVAPWVVNKTMGKIAKNVKDPGVSARLSQAVKMTGGCLDADILPIGLQQIYSAVFHRPGSKGIFDTTRTYKNIIRSGSLLEGMWPTTTKNVDVNLSLSLDHPELFQNAGNKFNDIINAHTGENLSLDFDAVKSDFRAFVEGELQKADIDINNDQVRAAIDDTVINAQSVMDDVVLNKRGNTEADFQNNLNKAFEDYFDTRLGVIKVGEQGIEVPYYPKLTPWERHFAKLTDAGTYSELQKGQAKSWFKRLAEFTPESKASITLDLLTTNTMGILDRFSGDVESQINLLHNIADQDPVAASRVMKAMIQSPSTQTTVPVIKSFMDSGLPDEMMASYIAVQGQRGELGVLSKALGQTDANLLQMIEDNPQKVVQMIKNMGESGEAAALNSFVEDINNGVLTPETLSERFEIFVGKNYIPWNDQVFQAELLLQINKHADKFLVDYYGIEPKPFMMRLSSVLKSGMSLAVLGFNPGYAFNNWINNVDTRAAQGVFGMMTPKQIDRLWNRVGIKPSRLDVGTGPAEIESGYHRGGQAITAAMDKGDFVGKMNKLSRKANRLGIFSNLAAKIERAESRQANSIGFIQAWDKTWKPGLGFDKLPAQVESALADIHPDIPNMIYSLTSQGMNMDEITNSLYSRSKFQGVESTLQRAVQDIFTNDTARANDIIEKSGIKLELIDLLQDNPSKEDINYAFDYMKGKLDAVVEQSLSNDLIAIPEDVKNRIRAEGWSAMMPLWSELWGHFTARRLMDFAANQMTAQLADAYRESGNKALVRKVWNQRFAEAETQWKRTHNMMVTTAQGMIQAIGATNPAAQRFINLMRTWGNDWDSFYIQKKLELQKHNQQNLKGAQRQASWDATQERIANLYDQHIAIENIQLANMFEELGKVYEETSHRPASEVMAWGDDVVKSFEDGQNAVKEFREGLRNTNMPAKKVRQAFETFNTETYRTLIKEQRNKLLEGAQRLAQLRPEDFSADRTQLTPGQEGATQPAARIVRFEGAIDLRNEINKRAGLLGDIRVTDKQRNALAGLLSKMYPDDVDRHMVQEYLFGAKSTKKMNPSKVKAGLDLFISIDSEGREVYKIPKNLEASIREAFEANKDIHQAHIWKPADNASDAEKARYNEQQINQQANDEVAEQQIHSRALINRSEFKTKLRRSFNLTNEQGASVMSIADAHAEIWGKSNGKSADAWYSENIGDITRENIVNPEGLSKTWIENGKHIIKAFQGADVESALHELSHVFRFELDEGELNTLLEWVDYKADTGFAEMDQLWADQKLAKEHPDYQAYMDANEKWSESFITYLKNEMALDVAPPALINVFKKFSGWIKNIYNSLTKEGYEFDYLKREIPPEMKSIYDGLFFDQDATDMRQTLSRKLQHMPAGYTTNAIGAKTHNNYNMQFRIVELNDLITSHTLDFVLNKFFPQELQSRFRELGINRAQILDIISRFNPDEMINVIGLVEAGPAIIGSDMVVESGNGRTLALAMMIRDYPEKFKSYTDALTANLDNLGFTPESIEGIEHPVLVRLRLDDVDRISFVEDANGKRIQEFTTLEAAYADAKYWDANTLANLKTYSTTSINEVLSSMNNEEQTQGFLNNVPQNEKSNYIASSGGLSDAGIEKMKATLLARVFKGDKGKSLVTYFSEKSQTDNIAANIRSSTENVLAEIAKVEGMIENGRLLPEMSIASDVSDVIYAYLNINRRYGSFAEFQKTWEGQASIYGDAYVDIGLVDVDTTPEIREAKIDLLHFYAENSRKVVPQTQLWKRYADRLFSEPQYMPGQPDMFGIEQTPKHELIRNVLQSLVDEGKTDAFRDYKPQGTQAMFQSRVMTDVPPAGTPIPRYEGRITSEAYTETLSPLLEQMQEIALRDMDSGHAFSLGDIPDDLSNEVQAWMARLPGQMAGTKLNAIQYGELMRDRALLNYQERYGIDDYAQMVFPYEFWFTRTMGEWGKRLIEKPAWMTMYARLRRNQKKMEQEGIPSRLKGTMRFPAAFTPDWMGDALYIDPLKKLFPFTEFSAPMEMAAQQGQNVEYAAIQYIQTQVKEGLMTATRAKEIIETREGPEWQEAMAEAQVQSESKGDIDAMSLASMMMTPAMWWTYPYHILKGTPEQLYPLPGTRAGQALREYGGPLGVIGNIMALPEETIRRKFNLSEYGEWGDYYVNRTLSNMAGEGLISSKEAVTAMLERQGEFYDIAYDRVQKEMALKIPGSQTGLALKEGRLGAVMYTLPTTLFPAGLLPEGELIQRGLKNEYSKAWDAYDKGNPTAVNEFFEKYPEYQARIALFKEPEEQLHQFLISEIWEKWHELENKNKPLVIDQLGQGFERMFLNEDTKDYTAIDNETLAYWSQMLGGLVPETEETKGLGNAPLYQQEGLQLYKPEVLAQVEDFQSQREELFPNYKGLQTMYWSLPEDQRKGFVNERPELKEYWSWKDEYYELHPLVEKYQEEQKERYNAESLYTNTLAPGYESVEEFTAKTVADNMIEPLQMQLMFYYFSGESVKGGARTMLMNTWTNMGSPGGDFETWLAMVLEVLTK